MEQKYDVFISYSRKDYVDENKNVIPGNVVSQVKDMLSKEGISYWFDEEGINYGQDFIERIISNIEASKVFLFLSTKNSNQSPWTCKEIASADMYNKYILPVRIDHSPYNKKVMFRISDLNYIDYFTNPEKGLNDLISAIKTHLHQLDQEKRIEEIRKECDDLNKEKQKLAERNDKLIENIKATISSEHQAELLALISDSTSKIALNKLDAENKLLKEKIKHLESTHTKRDNHVENAFMYSIKTCLRKYVNFTGRASRSEFWWWYLFAFVLRLICIVCIINYIETPHTLRLEFFVYLYLIIAVGGLLPTLSVAVRRCHDTNHSGWWILCPIYNIILMCTPAKKMID